MRLKHDIWGKMKITPYTLLRYDNVHDRSRHGDITFSPKNSAQRSDVSFKGLNPKGVGNFISRHASSIKDAAHNFYSKHMFGKNLIIGDYTNFVKETDKYIGKGFTQGLVSDFQNLSGANSKTFVYMDNNRLIVRDENIVGKLAYGIADIFKVPFDIINASLRGLAKVPFLKKSQTLESISNIPVLKNRANEKAARNIYYKLKGLTGYASDPASLRKAIFDVPSGPPVGNYKTKDERGLNRAFTGSVSAAFAFIDFYNLGMYETNNPKEAKKAGKRRWLREMGRIGISAAMTYSVLSALSSYVNKSKALACAAIAGSALFAEVITRVVANTPLTPLTPERAKEYNKKRREREERKRLKDEQKEVKDKLQNTAKTEPASTSPAASSAPLNPATNTPAQPAPAFATVFSSASSAAAPSSTPAPFVYGGVFGSINNPAFSQFTNNPYINTALQNAPNTPNTQFKGVTNNNKDDKKNPAPKREPFGIKEAGIAALALIAFDLVYALMKSKVPKFSNGIDTIKQQVSNFYNKYSKTTLSVKRKDLAKFLEGFDGLNMGSIKKAYSGMLDLRFTKSELAAYSIPGKDGSYRIDSNSSVFKSAYKRVVKEADSLDAKFKSLDFKLDLSNPASGPDGELYYAMKSPVFDFGRIKDTKTKILLDALGFPVKTLKKVIFFPQNAYNAVKKIFVKAPKETAAAEDSVNSLLQKVDFGELFNDCSVMFKKYKRGSIDKKAFSAYIDKVNTKMLDTDTTAKYPQTALASTARNFVTLISSYFFINDFRNEVLIQSNGENTEKAAEVTKERTAHKISNFVFNKFFMELFNHTFQKAYLGSLAGASLVAAATEVTNESCVRLSIGVPLKKMSSREEIDAHEKKHLEKKGITGWYYRTMAWLTGKKMLSEKASTNK